LADEVGWLLGVQFCVGVVPAGDAGSACLVAGNPEYVLQAGKQAYAEEWQLHRPERAELVVMAVGADAAGHGWEQVSRALETARQLVERKGRIVLLTELTEAPSPGIQMLSQFRSPKAALKPLRAAMPPDVVAATRIAQAAEWAEVFLYSQLPDQTVEDLFLHPLGSLTELQRLLDAGISTSVISGGQYALVDPD
jgi:nickel-dependent lactate racemase